MDKQEALVAKQKQAMSSFFKPKPVMTKPSATSEAGPSSKRDVPSFPEAKWYMWLRQAEPKKVEISDFDRTFKPVAFRPNVEWAPVNRFRYNRRSITPDNATNLTQTDDWSASGDTNPSLSPSCET